MFTTSLTPKPKYILISTNGRQAQNFNTLGVYEVVTVGKPQTLTTLESVHNM